MNDKSETSNKQAKETIEKYVYVFHTHALSRILKNNMYILNCTWNDNLTKTHIIHSLNKIQEIQSNQKQNIFCIRQTNLKWTNNEQ